MHYYFSYFMQFVFYVCVNHSYLFMVSFIHSRNFKSHESVIRFSSFAFMKSYIVNV